MGTYIYTYKKKLDKKAILNGQEVKVGEATFLCKRELITKTTMLES